MSEPSRVTDGPSAVSPTPAPVDTNNDYIPTADEASYWKANLRLLAPLLAVWALVSYGAGILFVDQLNQLTLPFSSCPLGFWFAQQGSIFVFVGIIYAYVLLMNWLDRKMGVQDDE